MLAVRKPRAPMTIETKAAMMAKRAATIAANQMLSDAGTVKTRKPRAPMSAEAKQAMQAKRLATIAAKKGTWTEPKARKPREPMTTEAKQAMLAKRLATIAAKKGTWTEPKPRKPREPMTTEAKALMAAKRLATVTAKKMAMLAAKQISVAEPAAHEPAAHEPPVTVPEATSTGNVERDSAYNYIAMLMDQGANMKNGVRYLVKDRGLDTNTATGYLVDYMVTEAGQRGFVMAEVKRRNMAAKAKGGLKDE